MKKLQQSKLFWLILLGLILQPFLSTADTGYRIVPENTNLTGSGSWGTNIQVKAYHPNSSGNVQFVVSKQSGSFGSSGTCYIRQGSINGPAIASASYSQGSNTINIYKSVTSLGISEGSYKVYYAVIDSWWAGDNGSTELRIYNRLTKPNISSPNNGQSVSSNFTVSLGAVPNATDYRFQISQSSSYDEENGFSQVYDEKTSNNTSVSFNVGNDAGPFYVIARAGSNLLYHSKYCYWNVFNVQGTDHDISVGNPSLDQYNADPGERICADFDMYYQGNAQTNFNVYGGFYFSSNNSYGSSDDFLSDDYDDLGLMDQSVNLRECFDIPDDALSGTNYIIFYGDYDDQINENNENNNTTYQSIDISHIGNLTIGNASATPSTLAPGEPISLSCDQQYEGNSSDWLYPDICIYLSTDQTLGNGQLLADEESSLKYNDLSDGMTTSINIPANTPDGQYYLLFVADCNEEVDETSEIDNMEEVMITIESPQILEPIFNLSENGAMVSNGDNYSIAGATSIGTATDIEFSIENTGQADLALSNFSSSNPDFTFQVSPVSPVPPSGSSSFTIRFKPLVSGIASSSISITNNDNDQNPFQFTIEGEGTNNTPPPYDEPPYNNSAGTFRGQAQIDGLPAEQGDWIAAFNPSGEVAGAVEIIMDQGTAYISLPIYGDDGSGNGMTAGQDFTLGLYDVSEDAFLTFPNIANPFQFSGWANYNGAPIPNYDSFLDIYNFVTVSYDTIYLSSGWNLISLDVTPVDTDVVDVFSSLRAGNLNAVTHFNQGYSSYDPSAPPFANLLTDMEDGYGYWVNVAAIDTLIVAGLPVLETFKVNLNPNANLVGYIPQISQDVTLYFDPLISSSNLQIVTTFDNNGYSIYDPSTNIGNTLTAVENGRGYWVYVQNATLGSNYFVGDEVSERQFTSCSDESTSAGRIGGTINNPMISPDVQDEVRAVSSADYGVCYGKGTVSTDQGVVYFSLSVNGDDPFTPIDEGILLGECFTLIYLDVSTGIEYVHNTPLCDWQNMMGAFIPAYSDFNTVYTFNEVVLPLEMLGFTIRETDGYPLLSWETAFESATSHFEIQRSTNGQDFETIGKLNTKGESANQYVFSDRDASKLKGTLYYRLKVVDQDESHDFSKLESIKLDAFLGGDLSIYPNPVRNQLTIQYKVEDIAITVYNSLGQQQALSITHPSASTWLLDTSVSPKGTYFLHIISQNETFSEVFVIH